MKSNQTKSIGLRTGILITLALLAIQGLAQSTYEPYTFTTLAGGGGFNSPGEAGTAARFSVPAGVAVDRAGNVYVADTGNHAIRQGTQAGAVTRGAGGPGTYGRTGGRAGHG